MIIVPSLKGGGQERVAALTSVILRDDYDITFVVFDGNDSRYRIAEGANYINLDIPSSNNVLQRVYNSLRRARQVRKIRKTVGTEYSMSFGKTANLVNCIAKENCKTIVSVRNSSASEIETRSITNNLVYHRAYRVVCVSEGQKNRLLNAYPEIRDKTVVIYNPCDYERIGKNSEKYSKNDNGHSIVAVGRLEAVKCYKNLFNAIGITKRVFNDVTLTVLGDGNQRDDLEEYIKQNDMGDYIRLLGFKEDPFEVVAGGDMFVLSSSREGFPNVVVEALACGVPIVSTDCEFGPREILSGSYIGNELDGYTIEDYGILTPPFEEGVDEQGEKEKIFADAIIRVFQDEELRDRLVKEGLKRAYDFSMKEYKKRFDKAIGERQQISTTERSV